MIYVYADWKGLSGTPLLMGMLNCIHSKGKEIFSFEYMEEWLASGNGQILDPDLHFYGGRQYSSGDKLNFGLFLDSSPDKKVVAPEKKKKFSTNDKKKITMIKPRRYLNSPALEGLPLF